MNIVILDQNTVSIGDIDLSVFDKLGNVKYFDAMENELVAENIGEADAVILNKAIITKDIINKCPNLKYIGLFATGYNNVDTLYARKRGIVVCNAPNYSTDSVVQQVFALLLQISTSTDKYAKSVRNGEWILSPTFSYFPYPIIELSGKTMGIVGFGSIGKKVAEVAKAFGMKVIVNTRTIPEKSEYTFVSKTELFEKSDVISLNCPLTSETEKMINEDAISHMKENTVIINTSRGGTIDEAALAKALKDKRIFAAGLDVLTKEPMEKNCPLKCSDNCTITPHIAWASLEARQRLVKLVYKNLECFIEGKPINAVN